MKDVIIRNASGQQINTKVVRYFRLNSFEYLIFCLNEIDDGGYVKLYVSKIIDGVGKTINDDVEWNMIKDTIKTIIKSNKDGQPLPIIDLSSERINNLQIFEQKVFKLNDSLLQLLSTNQKVENVASSLNNIEYPEMNSISDEYVDAIQPNFNYVNTQDIDTNQVQMPQNFAKTEDQDANPNIFGFNRGLNDFANVVQENKIDYELLYNEQLVKNKELANEIEKYKKIINILRSTLDQDL